MYLLMNRRFLRGLCFAVFFLLSAAHSKEQIADPPILEQPDPTFPKELDRNDVKEDIQIPVENIRALADAFSLIKSYYVDQVSDKRLLEYAIRGMFYGLDPHSVYLDKKELEDFESGTQGEYSGIGIEISFKDGALVVVSPIDDTPADRAGILAEDIIVRINDVLVRDISLEDASRLLRGDQDSKVTLTILRENFNEPIELSLVREVIKSQSVHGRILEPNFGYVRISQFQARTTKSLVKELEKMSRENGGNLFGLILDLRNNPGGLLYSAIEVADLFLEKGDIVQVRGNTDKRREVFSATFGDVLSGAPLVLLVNAGSASASEVVAGALQDNNRAILFGEETFGKGSVQETIPLLNGGAVKLTTARYYTPSGTSIQAKGIIPDIVLPRVLVSKTDVESDRYIHERNLNRHLKAQQSTGNTETDRKEHNLTVDIRDYAITQALNTLKAMALRGGYHTRLQQEPTKPQSGKVSTEM